MTDVTTRRAALTDAAIATLAESGMRGFTHRAVDRTAGLPEGSCSYYFRTRRALIEGTVARIVELNIAELQARRALAAPTSLVDIAETTAQLVEYWTTTARVRTLARYELVLESTRRPELRRLILAAGEGVRALGEEMLTVLGVSEPARRAALLIACVDGVVFDHLAGAGARDLDHAELRTTVLALLESFARSGPASPRRE